MPTDNSPLFIFEMANNHQGDINNGLRIVDEMAKIARTYRIRAGLKLQYRNLNTFIHPNFRNSEIKHIKRFLSTELSNKDYEALGAAIKASGMISICTPFDEESVSSLVNHGIDIVKVASCSANDWPLLEKIVATTKPVICSTGGLRSEAIDQVVNFFEHRRVTHLSMLHCTGIYPTQNPSVQMNAMDWMMRRYHWLDIGYSGHEAPENLDVVKVAVAKGAKILERHVGLATDTVKLNNYSMNPDQTQRWVESALSALEICGPTKEAKHVAQEEIESLRSLARGVYVRSSVKKGETLTPDKVFLAIPWHEDQTSAAEYSGMMVASRDYVASAPLQERRPVSVANTLRSLIHQAKGMLYEAKIMIGDDYKIEMSHHYGPESFRTYGALIVNLINREYCKKLIIVLPGQSHPKHRHLKKEETFQLLHGDLQLVTDGATINLRPGQMETIHRGGWHSFSSINGAIFEEVSTTHIVGDSYYEDPKIASIDPIQRKTVLDMW